MKRITGKIISAAAVSAALLIAFTGCAEQKKDKKTDDKEYKSEVTEESESETEETTTEETAAEPSDTSDAADSASDLLGYQIIPASTEGGSDERGYYVFEDAEDMCPYKIVIAMGERSTGGYDIEITDVVYDGSALVITVKETSPDPTDFVTEAFTYPCCAIELTILPDDISVVSESGVEFECLNTYLDGSDIEDGWLCVIEDGGGEIMRKTYVYETADGGYEYINVESTTTSWGAATWNDVIKGSGTADTREEVVDAAEEFGSCGFVLLPGDYQTVYMVEDFVAGKAF